MSTFINLEGTCNTRDIGSIETKYKTKIKTGLLYRSDKLSYLTHEDYDILRKHGIKQIIDFRSPSEKEREPNIVPIDFIYKEIPIPLDAKIINEIKININYSSYNHLEEIMKKCNRDFIIKYSEQFSEFLKTIISNKIPTLFHCSFGKDRTGFATSIIYYICGVSMDNIYKEYMKSNDFIKKDIENEFEHLKKILNFKIKSDAKLLPLVIVKKEYLQDSFNSAKNIYGSFDEYISYKLKLTTEKQIELKYYLLE